MLHPIGASQLKYRRNYLGKTSLDILAKLDAAYFKQAAQKSFETKEGRPSAARNLWLHVGHSRLALPQGLLDFLASPANLLKFRGWLQASWPSIHHVMKNRGRSGMPFNVRLGLHLRNKAPT